MKTQHTIQPVLLSVILTLVILGGHASAQLDFFDDFSDGDPADGSPVTWHPIFVWDGTGYTLTPEGLEVAGALLTNPDGTVPVYDDVAITTEISRHANNTGAEWASGFLFRHNANWTNGYWMEVRAPNRFVLGYSSGAILAQVTLPFNVDEQDMTIHMEARGRQIEGWCWAKGQSMPKEPHFSVVDTRAATGQIALHAWTVGGQSIFRSVTVSSLYTPIIDFNGDGILNTTDLVTFIETWGQNDPATDFWRDGRVDQKDLDILMSCWGQEVADPTLEACWKLDETEGNVAYDSAGQLDAEIKGEATWLATEGQVNGTLQCNGKSNYVEAPLAIEPADNTFSVFAWVKGGMPGQVILSQAEGMDWLMIDAEQGTLKTGLTQPAINIRGNITEGPTLTSSATITDGNWHRVGLVRDSVERILYVDNTEVARDTIDTLAACRGPICIGAGCALEADSFWSGMIDDVRIYNRAIVP